MQIKVNGKDIKAQILPVDKPTLDETLETFSFALISNTDWKPYAPCQSVEVWTDSGDRINLFLVTDSVEIYSLKPTRWKHNITCVQNTRKLSKHLVRNSVFSQPAYLTKKSFNSTTYSLCDRNNEHIGEQDVNRNDIYEYGLLKYHEALRSDPNQYASKLTLERNSNVREKIKTAYVEIACSMIKGYAGTPDSDLIIAGEWYNGLTGKDSLTNLFSESANFNFSGKYLTLVYRDSNNDERTYNLVPTDLGMESDSDWFPLNRKVRCKKIEELAAQGCNEFYIAFPSGDGTNFLSGFVYPFRGDYPLIFAFQIYINAETYYFSAYDILDSLRSRQRKMRYINGSLRGEDSLFELPTNNAYIPKEKELYDLLNATPVPNFTFTQQTMYECVADVFRLFDAIFTMDNLGKLGIEYFNDNNGRDITSSLKKVGQNSSSSEDKYTNGLVAYYQDGQAIDKFPNANVEGTLSQSCRVRSENYGVPQDEKDHYFITPKPIENIVRCYLVYDGFAYPTNTYNGITFAVKTSFKDLQNTYYSIGNSSANPLYGCPLLDISHNIAYDDIWSLMVTSRSDITDYNPFTLKQIYCLHFAKGTNKICVAEMYKQEGTQFDKYVMDQIIHRCYCQMLGCTLQNDVVGSITHNANGNWRTIRFSMEYIAPVDGRVKVESYDRKYDGETLVDQYNGAVDLNKMGLNILGLTLKLGNPTLTVTQKITKWANRVKQGDIYNYEGKKWIANVVSYTLLGNGYVQATIEFVQNFNALAMNTRLLRTKRLSNVSRELTIKSEENIVDYIYFYIESNPDAAIKSNLFNNVYPGSIAMRKEELALGLANSLGRRPSEVDTPDHPLQTFDSAGLKSSEQSYSLHLPMVRYGCGNAISFEFSYDDPMNAGNQTQYVDDAYLTMPTFYTNDSGFAYSVSVFVTSSRHTYINEYANDEEFPKVSYGYGAEQINIDRLVIRKQPNEIFALNYQVAFLPVEKDVDFIGSTFINDNFFINDKVRKPKDLKLYVNKVAPQDSSYKYSVFDTKVPSDAQPIEIRYNQAWYDTSIIRIVINIKGTFSFTRYGFALGDNDGNILFASNKPISADTNLITLYFEMHNERVDQKVLSDLS